MSSHVATLLLRKGDLAAELAAAIAHAKTFTAPNGRGDADENGIAGSAAGSAAGSVAGSAAGGLAGSADGSLAGEGVARVAAGKPALTSAESYALRQLADEERAKTQALKACLLRFVGQLTEADTMTLHVAGIALA